MLSPGLPDPGSYREFACGCLLWTQDDAVVIRACSASCLVLRHIERRFREWGFPAEYRWF